MKVGLCSWQPLHMYSFGLFFFFSPAQAFQEEDPERRNKNTVVLSLMFLLLGVITLATYIIQVSVTMLKC